MYRSWFKVCRNGRLPVSIGDALTSDKKALSVTSSLSIRVPAFALRCDLLIVSETAAIAFNWGVVVDVSTVLGRKAAADRGSICISDASGGRRLSAYRISPEIGKIVLSPLTNRAVTEANTLVGGSTWYTAVMGTPALSVTNIICDKEGSGHDRIVN